jgi:hypothetical protein
VEEQEKIQEDSNGSCLKCASGEAHATEIEHSSANKKARRWRAAGGIHTDPRLGFMPSRILRAKASKRKKRSRYSRGGSRAGAS